MSRITTVISIGVGLFLILVAQTAGIAALDPTKQAVLESDSDISEFNGESAVHGMYVAVTKWVPTIGGAGLILIGVGREYRRQREAAAVPRRGGPP